MCARCPCYSLSPRNVLRDICLDRTKRRQAGVGRWSDFHLTYVRLRWQVSFWNFRTQRDSCLSCFRDRYGKSRREAEGLARGEDWRKSHHNETTQTVDARRHHTDDDVTAVARWMYARGHRDLQSWGSARVGSCGLFHRGRFYSGWIAFCSLGQGCSVGLRKVQWFLHALRKIVVVPCDIPLRRRLRQYGTFGIGNILFSTFRRLDHLIGCRMKEEKRLPPSIPHTTLGGFAECFCGRRIHYTHTTPADGARRTCSSFSLLESVVLQRRAVCLAKWHYSTRRALGALERSGRQPSHCMRASRRTPKWVRVSRPPDALPCQYLVTLYVLPILALCRRYTHKHCTYSAKQSVHKRGMHRTRFNDSAEIILEAGELPKMLTSSLYAASGKPPSTEEVKEFAEIGTRRRRPASNRTCTSTIPQKAFSKLESYQRRWLHHCMPRKLRGKPDALVVKEREVSAHWLKPEEKVWGLTHLKVRKFLENPMHCYHLSREIWSGVRCSETSTRRIWEDLFLKVTKITCSIRRDQTWLKQELLVESLNKCIGELQRQTEEQRLTLQDAQNRFVESRREQVRLLEAYCLCRKKVLRKTQIRNMHDMGEPRERKNQE